MFEKRILFFDVETQKSAEEVGGWTPEAIRKMKLAVGVTFDALDQRYRIYGESQARELIAALRSADLVVGFNTLRFDYEVLRGYEAFSDPPSLDMLVEIQKTLGHRLALDSLAQATLGTEKTADGLEAIRWFKQGELLKIAEYCCHDVKITRELYEYGRTHRKLHYISREGDLRTVAVSW